MKLLLNEDLSRRIVPFLQSDFSGSSQVGNVSKTSVMQLLLDHREAIGRLLADPGTACIEIA